MYIVIPDNLLLKMQVSPENIKKELALFFFKKYGVSTEQASLIAGISIAEFEKLLSNECKKISDLESHNYIVGNPDELIDIDWSKEINNEI